jgi:hypothetical protein
MFKNTFVYLKMLGYSLLGMSIFADSLRYNGRGQRCTGINGVHQTVHAH